MRYVLFLLLVACGAAPSESPVSPTETPAKAGARSDTDIQTFAGALAGGATVFDVRTPQEFAAGHVPGAVNLPLGFDVSDPALAQLDKDAEVYLICQSGGRSGKAADQLAGAGFNAVNVKGGTGAWIAAGHPVDQ